MKKLLLLGALAGGLLVFAAPDSARAEHCRYGGGSYGNRSSVGYGYGGVGYRSPVFSGYRSYNYGFSPVYRNYGRSHHHHRGFGRSYGRSGIGFGIRTRNFNFGFRR